MSGTKGDLIHKKAWTPTAWIQVVSFRFSLEPRLPGLKVIPYSLKTATLQTPKDVTNRHSNVHRRRWTTEFSVLQ
jgi:hypothetical protein